MEPEPPRYAIYFTPDPRSPLWRFGSGVIGYDASLGLDVPLSVPEGYDIAGWTERTEEPRRYGFHATLKAPFHLAAARQEDDLLAAVDRLAAGTAIVPAIDLGVAQLGSFIALMIVGDDSHVRALASQVVTSLEAFRAPLAASDRERRLRAPLTLRQVAYLDRYGYPYVLEEFRFHMTLTGKLPDNEIEPVLHDLRHAFRQAVNSGRCAAVLMLIARHWRVLRAGCNRPALSF